MFRKLCIIVIFLTDFLYDVKINSSSTVVNGNVDSTSAAHKKVQQYFDEVTNFLNKNTIKFEFSPRPLRNGNLTNDIDLNKERKRKQIEILTSGLIENIIREPSVGKIKRNSNKNSTRNKLILPMKPEMNAAQLLASYGFRSESHAVLTSDGYMLTLQRIVPDTSSPSTQAVILHHGLLGSSEDWLILGPGLGLPFLLVDKGYDVWLLNARGNKYSKVHTTWYTDSYEFWDFSWHEIGVYDLPAAFTYISEYTKKADLYFIGHSMGATALLALLSTIPEYNDMLKSAFLLAPLAFMYNAKGPLKQLAEMRKRKGPIALSFLGTNDFLPSGMFPRQIISKFCKGNELVCRHPVLLLVNGGDYLDDDLMDNILSHKPGGGSTMTIMHYIQLVNSGLFQMFEYGPQGNFLKYKRKLPPVYNLDAVTLPISLFTSPSDWLSSLPDVTTLESKLKNIYLHHIVNRSNFGHMDFIWAKDAPELVFRLVLDTLEQISPMNSNNLDTVAAPTSRISVEYE